jgi:enterochelin esterase-like enzyme
MPSYLRWPLLVFLFPAILPLAAADPPAAQALIDRHRREKSPVWADGETATFFYRGLVDKVEVLFAGEFKSLERIADTNVWTLAVKRADLQRAVFSYRFLPTARGRPVEKPPASLAVWRGPKAPSAVTECDRLKGTLQHFEIKSKALGSPRKISVYLPAGHDSKKNNRVIYAADGEAIDRFARVLEPLISSGQVPPVVLVGVHSGGYVGGPPSLKNYDPQKDLRAQEYFPGLNAKRFSDHETFFCSEVPAWAEKRFGVSSAKVDRVIFGYSNGGRFVVEMGFRHPDLFGHVFGFSVAGNGKFDFGTKRTELPRFHLMAGTWEESFHYCTSSLAKQLKERKASAHFTSRVGGHDTALWREGFVAALSRE